MKTSTEFAGDRFPKNSSLYPIQPSPRYRPCTYPARLIESFRDLIHWSSINHICLSYAEARSRVQSCSKQLIVIVWLLFYLSIRYFKKARRGRLRLPRRLRWPIHCFLYNNFWKENRIPRLFRYHHCVRTTVAVHRSIFIRFNWKSLDQARRPSDWDGLHRKVNRIL